MALAAALATAITAAVAAQSGKRKGNANAKNRPNRRRATGTKSPNRPLPTSAGRKRRAQQQGMLFAPAAVGQVLSNPGSNLARNGIRVSHSEMFALVRTSQDFAITTFPIQPGNTTVFPWLSAIATRFERYHLNSIIFRYIPSCPTSETGAVMLSPDSDVLDDPPATFEHGWANTYSQSVVPWSPLSVSLPQSFLHGFANRLFTRLGSVGTNDLKTYDAGQIHIMTTGNVADDSVCGRVIADYDIMLYTPQFNAGVPCFCAQWANTDKLHVLADMLDATATNAGNLEFGVNDDNEPVFLCTGEWVVTIIVTGTVITAMTLTNLLEDPRTIDQTITDVEVSQTVIGRSIANSTEMKAILSATTMVGATIMISPFNYNDAAEMLDA